MQTRGEKVLSDWEKILERLGRDIDIALNEALKRIMFDSTHEGGKL